MTVTQFKVECEQERLVGLTEQTQQKAQEVVSLEKEMQKIQKQQTAVQKIDQIEAKSVAFIQQGACENAFKGRCPLIPCRAG